MTKDKIEKAALLLLILAGMVYFYAMMIFWPKWSLVQQENAQLQEREQYYNKLLSYGAEPEQLDKKIANLEGQVRQLDLAAPKYLNKAQIMVSLYDLAKQYKVNPLNISFASAQAKGPAATVGITFVCSGTASGVLALTKTIEEDKKLPLALNGMNLTVEKGVMQAQLKLTGYALTGGTGAKAKTQPPFMHYPFGFGSTAQMFH